MDEDEDGYIGGGKSKKPKRGVLPKHATSIMRSWLFQHLVVSAHTNPHSTPWVRSSSYSSTLNLNLQIYIQRIFFNDKKKKKMEWMTFIVGK
jgi:hypothetical protein